MKINKIRTCKYKISYYKYVYGYYLILLYLYNNIININKYYIKQFTGLRINIGE